MLDRRWRKVWRDLWLHRTRSLLVVCAVAVGLAAAGSLLNAWALVRLATGEGYRASLPVSATLRVEDVDAGQLAQLEALPQIAAVRTRHSRVADVQVDGEWRVAWLFALDDYKDPSMARLDASGGRWPPADGELVIEKSSLDFSGAAPGDSVQLQLRGQDPQALTVGGVVRDVSLAPGWMEHVVYAYTTPATLVRLGAPPAFNEIQLRVRDADADRATVRRVAYAAKALLERGGAKVHAVTVPEPGQHVHAGQMDSLLMVQGAFALLGLLVCAFLVVNLVSALLAGQVREIGVMKTLGAGSTQIAAMYLVLALVLGLLATLVAVPIAWFVGRDYAGLKADMLNFPIEAYAIPAWAVLLQVVVGCLLPVAAAAVPVARACRMTVGQALRDIGIVADGRALHARRLAWGGGWSRPLLLSIGNAFRRRQRMWLTLLALAVGGAVYLGAANLRVAVIGSVDLLYAAQRHDFSLKLSEPHAAQAVEAVAASVPGVRRAEAWRGASVAFAQADGTLGDAMAMTALPPTSSLYRPTLLAGRWLRPDDRDALVIGRSVLQGEPALAVGSVAELVIDGRSQPWTIVGIADGGPEPGVYAARAALDALHGNRDASRLLVALDARDLATQLDAIRRLRDALEQAGMPVASSQAVSENRRVLEDHLLMVVEFLGAMGWIMILVGGMGLASTMSLGVLERTREIGVLRAIGARHGAIVAMIQVEGLVVAVLGWLLALPLSIPVSVLLADAFGRVMFTVPASLWPDAGGVLRWLLFSVLISLLACALPARRATHIPTAAALNYQ